MPFGRWTSCDFLVLYSCSHWSSFFFLLQIASTWGIRDTQQTDLWCHNFCIIYSASELPVVTAICVAHPTDPKYKLVTIEPHD